MSNTAKLRKRATEFEQKKQFDKALQLYIQLLNEAGRELDDSDLQLYNRVGDLLFLSGVGPRERGTKKIPGVELDAEGKILSYDIETQVRSVFQNVRWILEDAGSSWEKIVDVTVFLTNMKDDFQVYNRLWKEYFEKDPPCRTTLEINCLPTPIAIELKVVAMA